ncbi:MAG: Bax inhibitor-1/YccA family protein [Gammaproteobacteria bacterium]|nr:Bax inhibitor-1/YccA family protein [Gammaproteobacteria bacterium]
MQSDNPMLRRAEFIPTSQPMSIAGAVNKSMILTIIAAVIAIAFYAYSIALMHQGVGNPAPLGAIAGAVAGLVLVLIMTFKPTTSSTLAIPYAVFEGLFLGGVSAMYETRYPGVPASALLATFVTTISLFALYRAGIIRATEKFKSIVISATIAIALIFVVQMIMQLAFSSTIPGLFEQTGVLAIGFAAFVAIIASLNLILDFDLIERCAQMGAPKYMEWFCATALLATLVWMYISFLRLLGTLRN